MPSKPNNPLAKLKARTSKTNAGLIRKLQQAKKDIAGDIARIAARKDIATSAKTREELYAEVAARFKTLSDGIDAQLKELIEGVARDTHGRAVEEIESKGADPVIRYDPARTRRYFDLVRPGNGKNLAAVFTDNMSAEAIRQLRTSFVDVFRQGSVKGMTANDMQKELQRQWNERAGNGNAFRFRDRSGRAWDNAAYLQMLVRTNAQRVSIDSYVDTLTESGFNLAKISEDGDPDCPVCAAWEGRIVQLSGESDEFPTLADARAAGMFHPNCVHRTEYVDELLDADEIARQRKAGKPTPAQMADRKAMQESKDAIDRSRYTDGGMTPEEADRAVTADRLERVIRAGTLSEDAAAAARSLPPDALDAIRKGGIPSFQTAKKGEAPGWRKGSAGGVVRVPKDATAKDVLDALGYEAANPEPPKQADAPKAPPKRAIGKTGDWKTLGLPDGESYKADKPVALIPAKDGAALLEKGKTVTTPLGDSVRFDAVTSNHLYKRTANKPRSRGDVERRLSEFGQAVAAIETPHEVWLDVKNKRRVFVQFTGDDGKKCVINVVDDKGHVYSWHANEHKLDYYRKGKLLWVRK